MSIGVSVAVRRQLGILPIGDSFPVLGRQSYQVAPGRLTALGMFVLLTALVRERGRINVGRSKQDAATLQDRFEEFHYSSRRPLPLIEAAVNDVEPSDHVLRGDAATLGALRRETAQEELRRHIAHSRDGQEFRRRDRPRPKLRALVGRQAHPDPLGKLRLRQVRVPASGAHSLRDVSGVGMHNDSASFPTAERERATLSSLLSGCLRQVLARSRSNSNCRVPVWVNGTLLRLSERGAIDLTRIGSPVMLLGHLAASR